MKSNLAIRHDPRPSLEEVRLAADAANSNCKRRLQICEKPSRDIISVFAAYGVFELFGKTALEFEDDTEVHRFFNGLGITVGGSIAQALAQNVVTGLSGFGSGILASVTAGSLYFCLHTAAPVSPHADATSNEITYPNYARQAGARSTGGFTVASTNVLENAGAVTWPACGTTGSTFTANDWSLTVASSGASVIFLFGTVTSPPTFGQGVSPLAAINALTATFQ